MCILVNPHTKFRYVIERCVHAHTSVVLNLVPYLASQNIKKSILKFEGTLKVLKFIQSTTQSTSLSKVSVGRPLNLVELHYEMRTRSQLTKKNCTLEINTLKVKS